MNGQITVDTLLAEEARLLGERRLVLFSDAQPKTQLTRVGLDESGGRFDALVNRLKKRGDVDDPAALAAWIGRKKYGKAKFQKMSRREDILGLVAAAELFEKVDYTADWAADFGKRLKAALEKTGDVGDFKVEQGGNVNAYVRGTLDGKKFEIEIRAKRKYERNGSPMYISALKVGGEWMPGSNIGKVVAALGAKTESFGTFKEPAEDDGDSAAKIMTAFEAFLKVAEKAHNDYARRLNPSGKDDKLGYTKGPKYWRIYVMSGGREDSKSAFGFFEPATGNLYKSEGWKKPAKGVRANVLDKNTWNRAAFAGIR